MYRKARAGFSDELLREEWRLVDYLRGRATRPVDEAAQRFIRSMLGRIAEAMRAREGSPVKAVDPDVLEIAGDILDLYDWLSELKDEILPALRDALKRGFETGQLRVSVAGLPLSETDADVIRVLDEIMRKAESVPETIREAVGREVLEGLRAEETWSRIGQRVQELAEDMPRWKADQIAQTSGTAAFEAGQLKAFKDAGVEKKRWLSQRDGAVRPSHYAADGQEKGLDEPFEVGGHEMQHPGDPGAPAREVVACRCTMLPVIED